MGQPEAYIELKSKLDSWLNKDSSRSLTSLARNSGVPYSTIKRIYKGDSKPALENLVAILSEILPRNEMAAYLNTYFPVAGKAMGIQELVKGSDRTADSYLRDYYRDEDALVIMELSHMHRGTSKEEVRNLLGLSGLNMLEVLEGNELVKEDEEGRIVASSPRGTVDYRIGLNKIRAFSKSFLRTQKSMIAIQSESLKKEAIKEIVKLLNETQTKIDKIMSDKSNHGDFPASAIMTVGLLDMPTKDYDAE